MIPRNINIKKNALPESPGVYLMKDAQARVLYVGKAGNLRRRVTSYFTKAHDARIEARIAAVRRIDYEVTDTAIEALIREAALIKKLSPPYNVREKDDKSFLYVEITKETFPRVLLVRGQNLLKRKEGKRLALSRAEGFGPFTSAASIREALRILRRLFPWSTHPPEKLGSFTRPCFEYEIGLCPGTCISAVSRAEYAKNIKNLERFFGGKKEMIVRALNKEMQVASAHRAFEKAEKLRRRLFALRHIQDVALIGHAEFRGTERRGMRIEGYDISNISGTSAVGSMVVFESDKPNKEEYRKFRIRSVCGIDDIRMLREVLERRFRNTWPLPWVIIVDGGVGQVNAARAVVRSAGYGIPVIGIAKGPERKRNDIVGVLPRGLKMNVVVRVRDEAHRFAIGYHKKLRSARFFG